MITTRAQRNIPVFPDFPEEEYAHRVHKLVEQMQLHDVDCVFLTQSDTVPYFTGHQTCAWDSKNAMITGLVTRDGDTILILSTSQEGNAIQTAFIDEIRVWGRPRGRDVPSSLIQALTETFRDHGLQGVRVGAELGIGQRINLPVAVFDEIRDSMPTNQFVDAAPLINRVKLIKSGLEIERIRQAAACTCKAIQAGLQALRPGVTEREIAQIVYTTMIQQGATTTGGFQVRAGPDRYRAFDCLPSDNQMRPGDVVFFDGGATYQGYWSDMARLGAIGSLSAKQMDMAKVAMEANQAAREAVRPGQRISDVFRKAYQVFEQSGYSEYVFMTVFGHGLGTTIHEAPRIGRDTEGVLEPGMVLAVEPGLHEWDLGVFLIEDNLVVTEDGHDLLTPIDRNVWVA